MERQRGPCTGYTLTHTIDHRNAGDNKYSIRVCYEISLKCCMPRYRISCMPAYSMQDRNSLRPKGCMRNTTHDISCSSLLKCSLLSPSLQPPHCPPPSSPLRPTPTPASTRYFLLRPFQTIDDGPQRSMAGRDTRPSGTSGPDYEESTASGPGVGKPDARLPHTETCP